MGVLTIPSIPIPPLIVNYMKMDPSFAGAWIGGFVDSTGAVIAAASIIKETGSNKAAINNASMVKMIQNIMIGPIALLSIFIIHGRKNLKLFVLWERLPKFVLGFLITMVMFTIYSDQMKESNQNVYKSLSYVSEWYA